jgi:ABC-2 type transport system ATP-binding protein
MISSAASLVIERLTYRYPGAERAALQDVSLQVEPGQRVGLLGPNGAGKTTLMRIVCGFLPVTSAPRRARGGRELLATAEELAGVGSGQRPGASHPLAPARVEVAGLDVVTASSEVRRRVGYLPELVPVYPELRVREHLAFRAAIKRVPWRQVRLEVGRVAALTGLEAMLETPIQRLSRGYRQRVGIADALLGSPPLVVLDEPTVGLDPNQVLAIRAMLKALGGKQTLVFSSHILAEVEALCDRVVILSRGAVVADETLSAATTSGLDVTVLAAPGRAREVIAAALGAVPKARIVEGSLRSGSLTGAGMGGGDTSSAEVATTTLRVELGADSNDAGTDVVLLDALRLAIAVACRDAGLGVVHLAPARRALEERFARVTGATSDELVSSGERRLDRTSAPHPSASRPNPSRPNPSRPNPGGGEP